MTRVEEFSGNKALCTHALEQLVVSQGTAEWSKSCHLLRIVLGIVVNILDAAPVGVLPM